MLKPVAQTVGLLADAASPVALFTIGAVLARSQMLAARHKHPPIPLGDYLPVAALKLFLHPLLVLVAALPSASNVSLLAERFGADNGRIARIILVSTAAAFVTFSLTGGELAQMMCACRSKAHAG